MNTTTPALADPAVEHVIALMRTTRMPHARAVVAEVLATAKAQRWDPTEVVRVLLEAEATGRNRSMLATRRKRACFPSGKTFEVWDEALSTLPAATTSFLRTLEWVRRRENLIACGPSGTGKTLLLEALGQQAIDEGMSVSWLSMEDLGALVRRHRIDDSVNKAITRATSVDLICIDLCRAGNYAEEFWMSLVEGARLLGFTVESAVPYRHSYRASRNAKILSGGWYRPGVAVVGATSASAFSLMVRSAWI